jgi:hypothetical protein
MSQKLGEGSIELAPESVTGVVGPSRAGQPLSRTGGSAG